MYGEPRRILESAARLDARADDIRHRAAELFAAARRTRWVSLASDRMGNRIRREYEELLRVARRYEDAAAAVREHAARVQQVLDLIEQIERRVRALVAGAWERIHTVWDVAVGTVGAAVSGVVDAVGGVFGTEAEAPDPQELSDRRLVATELPPEGHRDWLDVPTRLGLAA